jgi:hypothetical protein
MARAKRPAPEGQPVAQTTQTTQATQAKLKPVRLDLDAETHRYLRLIAAYEDESMAEVARKCVAVWVREEAKRRGIKL